MSAPRHACPIGVEDHDLPNVYCPCGWKGKVGALLGVDKEETLWCRRSRLVCRSQFQSKTPRSFSGRGVFLYIFRIYPENNPVAYYIKVCYWLNDTK